MAAYNITPANSVTTTTDGVHAFAGDTPLADALTVDSNAYLLAKGADAFGAFLASTQVWKVQVNGTIKSEKNAGLYLSDGNAPASFISVGAAGLIEGANGAIYSLSNATIVNAGTIRGGALGIYSGDAAQTIKNAGMILGGDYSILTGNGTDSVTNSGYLGKVALGDGSDALTNTGLVAGAVFMGAGADTVTNKNVLEGDVDLGAGNDKLTNSRAIEGAVFAGEDNDSIINNGTINKDVFLGNGSNVLTNSGVISGYVFGGRNDDVVKNTGSIYGVVDLGSGNDKFTSGNGGEIVVDGEGADTVKLGGGYDVYRAFGGFNQLFDGIDTIDGGAGAGDAYDANTATSALYINLDKVAHDTSPLAPNVGLTPANTAMTPDGLQYDKIVNFETVICGSGDDFVYGSSANNSLLGNLGADSLFGHGGADYLAGGAGGDTLVGGAGKDFLNGGAMADTFSFTATSDSGVTAATRDVIEDFASGVDLIDLRFIDANTKNGSVNDDFSFLGTGAFSGVAGQLRVYSTGEAQIVEGDINGDGKADFAIEVRMLSGTLNVDDFLL